MTLFYNDRLSIDLLAQSGDSITGHKLSGDANQLLHVETCSSAFSDIYSAQTETRSV